MRKFAIYALAGMLALPISVASAQSHFNQKGGLKPGQIPPTQTPTPVGFSSVVCVAEGTGISLPGPTPIDLGTLSISGSSVTPVSGGLSEITITITNNTTSKSSNYIVTFVDAGAPGILDCGDTIVSIVPA